MSVPDYHNPAAEAAYRQLLCALDDFPVRFSYGGTPHTGFAGLSLQSSSTVQLENREQTTTLFSLDENVTIRLVSAFYPSHGAYEWTVFFKNTGTKCSKVISEVAAVDLQVTGKNPVLRGILGDHFNLYRPYCKRLAEGSVDFLSEGGRPTHIWFPYFNLEYGSGGMMIALGWGGTWQALFEPTIEGAHIVAHSTNHLATYLKPGEEIRTALMSFLPYEGRDEVAATNLWRSWYIQCNMPKADAAGTPLAPFSTTALCGDTGLPNSDGSISERSFTWRPSLEKMTAEGIHVDFRWFDAGWYSDPRKHTVPSLWWHTVGSWELDKEKWPGNSFRESTDWARAHNMKTLVWFEPERVTDPEGLAENYGYNPKWGLCTSNTNGNVITNNIGDPECLAWTTGRILKFLEEQHVEMYREDNNSDSARSWRLGDDLEGADRCGITENKAVVGHYAMWDAIIAFEAAHDGCTFIDSCASGGGRNDLESMRRAIPLLRSDNDRTSTSLRLSMTSAFNKWIPMCGAATVERAEQLGEDCGRDKYIWRASYLPVLNVNAQWTQDPNTDFDLLRFGIREWDTVKPYLLKDFYLLTPWHPEEDRDGWTAFAFYDPEQEAGVLLAFRMENCPLESYTLHLPIAAAGMALTDADSGAVRTLTQQESEDGIVVTLPTPRSAALFYLKK